MLEGLTTQLIFKRNPFSGAKDLLGLFFSLRGQFRRKQIVDIAAKRLLSAFAHPGSKGLVGFKDGAKPVHQEDGFRRGIEKRMNTDFRLLSYDTQGRFLVVLVWLHSGFVYAQEELLV